MAWVLGRGGTILYKAMWTSAVRIGEFVEGLERQPFHSGATFYTEQLELRRRDEDAFVRGLERNGARAATEFRRAQEIWAERAVQARPGRSM